MLLIELEESPYKTNGLHPLLLLELNDLHLILVISKFLRLMYEAPPDTQIIFDCNIVT